MKYTTTTIDEILISFYNSACPVESIKPGYPPIHMHEAKQALLQWHKDKARSYVLEVIGGDESYLLEADKEYELGELLDIMNPIELRNKLRAQQRAKLDQTLKAIGGQENE